MLNKDEQQRRAKTFRDLHSGASLLILPNIWDPLGAALLEDLGYSAIATASASISYTQGVADGENLEFSHLVVLLEKIAARLSVPVTADIESGYAETDETLRKNITQILEAGIVGINIEDYDIKNNRLFPVDVQCRRLQVVRAAAEAFAVSLFINARTDVYARSGPQVSPEEKWTETRDRGKAYLEAGADGIYPITMNKEEDIGKLTEALSCPVNILAIPGIPDVSRLAALGVARLSLGPGFLKVAIRAMKLAAEELAHGAGLSALINNEISSDYLKKLVTRPG